MSLWAWSKRKKKEHAKKHQCIAIAASLFVPAVSQAATMVANVADAFAAGEISAIPQDGNGLAVPPAGGNPGGATLKVGSVAGATTAERGRAPVFPFLLPNIGAVANPFTSATFTTGVGAIDASSVAQNVNADLYGLSRVDAAPAVNFVDDYYLGTLDTTNATILQADFLTPTSTAGTNAVPISASSSAGGDAALLAFLNAQYANGAGANQYIYLRLNVDNLMTANTGYNVTTGDNASIKPTITFDAVAEPASLGLITLASGAALLRRRKN